MANIIIVTHGDFGAYLIEAAEGIVGPQDDGVRAVSISSRMSLESINAAVKKAAEELASPEGLIYLVDMPGGTPMNVVLPVASLTEKSAVICGINISMMISAFSHRNSLNFDKLVEKILADGKKAVCEVKSLLNNAKAKQE